MNNTLGENISRHRKMTKLTQEELAERMNVSSQAVSKWENDLSLPDIETIQRLAMLFGCTIDELVNGAMNAPTLKSSDPDEVDRRTLTIKVDKDGSDPVSVNVRFPVVLIKRAAESGTLKSLIGDDEEIVRQILPMIHEGAVGVLADVNTVDTKCIVAVEDYEG